MRYKKKTQKHEKNPKKNKYIKKIAYTQPLKLPVHAIPQQVYTEVNNKMDMFLRVIQRKNDRHIQWLSLQ